MYMDEVKKTESQNYSWQLLRNTCKKTLIWFVQLVENKGLSKCRNTVMFLYLKLRFTLMLYDILMTLNCFS